MPDSKKYLHPEAIRRIAPMELRAQRIVDGFLSGMHRSPYFGQSVEFVQHRQYVPGDDLRHIDWKVWGRQDRLYIKQYEEDTNLRCTLLVDDWSESGLSRAATTRCSRSDGIRYQDSDEVAVAIEPQALAVDLRSIRANSADRKDRFERNFS